MERTKGRELGKEAELARKQESLQLLLLVMIVMKHLSFDLALGVANVAHRDDLILKFTLKNVSSNVVLL